MNLIVFDLDEWAKRKPEFSSQFEVLNEYKELALFGGTNGYTVVTPSMILQTRDCISDSIRVFVADKDPADLISTRYFNIGIGLMEIQCDVKELSPKEFFCGYDSLAFERLSATLREIGYDKVTELKRELYPVQKGMERA